MRFSRWAILAGCTSRLTPSRCACSAAPFAIAPRFTASVSAATPRTRLVTSLRSYRDGVCPGGCGGGTPDPRRHVHVGSEMSGTPAALELAAVPSAVDPHTVERAYPAVPRWSASPAERPWHRRAGPLGLPGPVND